MSNLSFANQPGADSLLGVLVAQGAGVDPLSVPLAANQFLANAGAGYAAQAISVTALQLLTDTTASAMRSRVGVELAPGQVLVGNAGGNATPVTLTGDVTTSNTGVTAIGGGKVLNAMLENMAANSIKARVLNSIGAPSNLALTANTFPARDSAGNLAAWAVSDWMLNSFLFNNSAATARNALGMPTACFSANKNNVDQVGIATTTATKLTFTTEEYDTGSYYDAPNSKWTPPAGRVTLKAAVYWSSGVTTDTLFYIAIYKNGAAHKIVMNYSPISAQHGNFIVCDDVANGTDYYEVYGYGASATSLTAYGSIAFTFFQGLVA